MTGLIHSQESFGTVDGPGVRYVVFFAGCPMRCKYCHNPDTWDMKSCGTPTDTEEIIDAFERNRTFYTTGGITATGGEPLMQMDFLTELFKKAKARGIHTTLDTSGILFDKENPAVLEKFMELISVTDLVMLDIKHIDDNAHRELTGHSNARVLDFMDFLEENAVSVRVRHVIVPGITYDDALLERLGKYLSRFENIESVEVLPYHTMGIVKYQNLGISYPLEGVEPLSKHDAERAHEIIMRAMGK